MWKNRSVIRLALVAMALVLSLSFANSSARAQQGGAVTVGLAGEVDTLDQLGSAVGQAVGFTIFEALFDGLTRVNPTNGEIQPRLATSWRLLDQRTYLFLLRRGVKFHNGEDFDAESAKFSIELVESAKSWMRVRIPYLEKVEAVDRYTLRIRTTQPDVLLPAGLGDIPMYPRTYYQQVGTQGFSSRPVGTGLFKFARWDKGVRIVLERNDNYWGTKAGLQSVGFRPFVESSTRLAALEAGEIDMAINVPPDDTERLRRKGYSVAWTPSGIAMLIQFKLPAEATDTPLRDRRVRQALNYAVDKDALLKSVMLGYGKVLAGQLVGPDGFGYDPDLKPYPFDPKMARQLLAEAGFPNGLTIKFETSTGRYIKHREVSEALVGQLAQVGVKAQMEVLEWATFVRKALRTGDIAPLSYIGWLYSPAMDADYVFRNLVTDSPFKFFSNKRFDELYDRQRAETDRAKRRNLLRQASAVLREDPPAVFLFQGPNIFAVDSRVKGFQPTPDDKIHFDTMTYSR